MEGGNVGRAVCLNAQTILKQSSNIARIASRQKPATQWVVNFVPRLDGAYGANCLAIRPCSMQHFQKPEAQASEVCWESRSVAFCGHGWRFLLYHFSTICVHFWANIFSINGNGSSLNAMLDEQRLPRIRTNQQGYQPDPGPFVRCQ